jgi:hypothetical protein
MTGDARPNSHDQDRLLDVREVAGFSSAIEPDVHTLPTVDQVQTMTDAEVRALLVRLAAHVHELAALQTALAARLTIPSYPGHRTQGTPYTLTEAAALLTKSPVWLRRKAKTARVPGARKVGRSWLFERGPFDRWRCRPEAG